MQTKCKSDFCKLRIRKETKVRLVQFSNIYSSWDSVVEELTKHAENCQCFWEEGQ